MAITVDKAFVNEYSSLVNHLAQQGESRLRPFVTEVMSGGKSYAFPRLAKTDALSKSTRRAVTPYVDDAWTTRVAQPVTKNHTLTLEHEDQVQLLVDPMSAYAQNQANAMKRAYDDLIIAAATGTALDGDGNNNAFPAGQKIGDGTGVISFDIVSNVQEIFLGNDIDMDVPKVFVVGPTQVRKLMSLTQATSSDYVSAAALQQLTSTGIVPNWMGFTWIMSNRLLAPGAGELSCLAFTKEALGLAVNENMMVRIGEDPAHSYMMQVYAQFTAGAIRIQDEHIVHVHVKDAMA